MGTKFEPDAETLKDIIDTYNRVLTIAETARQFGISSSVISRILKENGISEPKKIEEMVYDGEMPVEPPYPTERNFNIHLEHVCKELIANGGIL